jgi:hypothetical protein
MTCLGARRDARDQLGPPVNPYGKGRIPCVVDPRERELLTGMGNCYEACGEDFDGTVEMVAHSRRRTPEDVKQTLAAMRQRYGADPDYQRLRERLPPDFPL